MFRLFKKTEMDAIEVIIGPQSTFNGVLRSDTSIRIDGAVEGGFVETPANVILTETSYVQCDIHARTVSIRGTYNGVVKAERVELLEGSQAYGTLNVDTFFMDEGASLNADLIIQGIPQNVTPPMIGLGYSQPLLEQDDQQSDVLALPHFSVDELSTRLPVDMTLEDILNSPNGAYQSNGNGNGALHPSQIPLRPAAETNFPPHIPTPTPTNPPPTNPPPINPPQTNRPSGPPSIPVVSPFPASGPPKTPTYQPISIEELENKANQSKQIHSNTQNSNNIHSNNTNSDSINSNRGNE
ncbi:MAG: polymer-forming cytoskeletal protein [Chloroflexota bacterium]